MNTNLQTGSNKVTHGKIESYSMDDVVPGASFL